MPASSRSCGRASREPAPLSAGSRDLRGLEDPPSAQESMCEDYRERIRRYTAGLYAGGVTEEYAESSAAWRGWRRELLAAERKAVVPLRDRGQITPEMMRRTMRDLDLEESRLGG
ncbi:MAG: hypothetical protein M3316_01220 [Actinomycetota bacterium]|nr:hypothetical protein [Actinomycetota bacterium]